MAGITKLLMFNITGLTPGLDYSIRLEGSFAFSIPNFSASTNFQIPETPTSGPEAILYPHIAYILVPIVILIILFFVLIVIIGILLMMWLPSKNGLNKAIPGMEMKI